MTGDATPHDFETTLRSLAGTGREDLAQPFLRLFPVTGASVATLGPVLGSETISASDDVSARLDELQFDLGEGPCWVAMRTGAAVVDIDLPGNADARWPTLAPAVGALGVCAVYAFPIRVGPLQLGAVDLWSDRPADLSDVHRRRAGELARSVSRIVLRTALEDVVDDEDLRPAGARSRRIMHQATGKVLVQAGVTPDDAHLLIQGLAFSSGRRVVDVSEDIVSGRLSFAATDGGIEENDHE